HHYCDVAARIMLAHRPKGRNGQQHVADLPKLDDQNPFNSFQHSAPSVADQRPILSYLRVNEIGADEKRRSDQRDFSLAGENRLENKTAVRWNAPRSFKPPFFWPPCIPRVLHILRMYNSRKGRKEETPAPLPGTPAEKYTSCRRSRAAARKGRQTGKDGRCAPFPPPPGRHTVRPAHGNRPANDRYSAPSDFRDRREP